MRIKIKSENIYTGHRDDFVIMLVEDAMKGDVFVH